MSESQENIQMNVDESSPAPTTTQTETPSNLTDVEVKDENVALNLLVSFLNLAQRRGGFNMQESAKFGNVFKNFKNNRL